MCKNLHIYVIYSSYHFVSLIFFPYHLLITPTLFFVLVQVDDALIQLYNHFISDFQTKINLLKFTQFTRKPDYC
jgi:hypothetical protein